MTTPFYVAPGEGRNAKRLLLFSYCFPPDSTVGALRWQRFAALAATLEWDLDVITLDPSMAVERDQRRLTELPPGTRVYGVMQREPFIRTFEQGALRWRNALRRLMRSSPTVATVGPDVAAVSNRPTNAIPTSAIPIADVRWGLTSPRGWIRMYAAWMEYARIERWAKDAAALGRQLARATRYRAIVSSGPPQMTYDAGRRVSVATGIPSVMDLRDPWRLSERLYAYFASPLWIQLAARHERQCVTQAALVVANTEPFRAGMAARYPEAAARIIAVTNGADDEPLPPRAASDDHAFSIRYAGTLYGAELTTSFFEAAAQAIRELGVTPQDFRIELIGDFGDGGHQDVMAVAERAGVGAFTTVGPRRPRAEALAFLAGATMLVSFPGFNESVSIRAKIFEYVRFPAWLLALVPPGSASAVALAGTSADVVDPENRSAMSAILVRHVRAYQAGERPTPVGADRRLTRRYQAEVLFAALDRCCG